MIKPSLALQCQLLQQVFKHGVIYKDWVSYNAADLSPASFVIVIIAPELGPLCDGSPTAGAT